MNKSQKSILYFPVEPNDSPRSNLSSFSTQRSLNNIIMMSPNDDKTNKLSTLNNSFTIAPKPNHLGINKDLQNSHVTPSPTSSLTSTCISTTNSSSLSDDFLHHKNSSRVKKSRKLTPRNPITGFGIQDAIHRPRKMDTYRGIDICF